MHAENITTQWINTSLEKYTPHFIWKGSKGLLKVLLYERWVEDWTELQHIDPHSYSHNSVSFPFSWAAQPGAWGPSLSRTWSSFQHLLSNWSELQLLNRGSWGPSQLGASSLYRILSSTDSNFLSLGLYNNLTPTLLPASVTISHSIEPLDSQGYILVFLDRMRLLFTQVHFLFWQLSRAGGQNTTPISSYQLTITISTFKKIFNEINPMVSKYENNNLTHNKKGIQRINS